MAPAPARPEPPLVVVEARTHWTADDLRELWRFRELFWFLTLRDVKLRYKQTILGVGWSVFQPLATMIVFAVFLGYLGKVAEGVPNYTLFVLAGVLPWTFFANATTNAGNSLVGNERLVSKTYFPRLLLPAANVGAALFDLLVCLTLAAVVLVGMGFYGEGVVATWRLLLLPGLIAGLGLLAFAIGTLLAALIATQRDFRYLLSFGMQLWMFATPCIYIPPATLGPKAQGLLPLNPVYGLVLNFRASLLGLPLDWYALGVSAVGGAVVLAAGLLYFRRVEHTMADVI
jgi:lipopolysaccharide transport system permease protein